MPAPKFSENFWGDKDDGFDVLLARMRQAKGTCKDLTEVIAARAAIEDDYSKKLLKLSKTVVGKDENGTLKDSLNTFKAELEHTAQSHATIAAELRSKVEKGLVDFVTEQSTARKTQARIMEKTIKNKVAQHTHVKRTKESFERKTKELEQLQIQETRGGLPPKDAEKLAQRVKKAMQASEDADKEFRQSVEKMHDIASQWRQEMVQTGELFQKLEEQRIDFLRSSLWSYSNILSTGCVADDESCERLRGSLEKCNIESDITQFVTEKATGTNIPEVIDYSVARTAIVQGLSVPLSTPTREMQPIKPTLSQDATDDSEKPRAKPAPASAGVTGALFQVRVLYDYDPQGPEELTLRENDVVAVVSDQEDPWWEGVINSQRGMFPSNFVERL